jgi:hypothetical protein
MGTWVEWKFIEYRPRKCPEQERGGEEGVCCSLVRVGIWPCSLSALVLLSFGLTWHLLSGQYPYSACSNYLSNPWWQTWAVLVRRSNYWELTLAKYGLCWRAHRIERNHWKARAARSRACLSFPCFFPSVGWIPPVQACLLPEEGRYSWSVRNWFFLYHRYYKTTVGNPLLQLCPYLARLRGRRLVVFSPQCNNFKR